MILRLAQGLLLLAVAVVLRASFPREEGALDHAWMSVLLYGLGWWQPRFAEACSTGILGFGIAMIVVAFEPLPPPLRGVVLGLIVTAEAAFVAYTTEDADDEP